LTIQFQSNYQGAIRTFGHTKLEIADSQFLNNGDSPAVNLIDDITTSAFFINSIRSLLLSQKYNLFVVL